MKVTFLILVTASFAALPRVRREVTDKEDVRTRAIEENTTTTMFTFDVPHPDRDDSMTPAAAPITISETTATTATTSTTTAASHTTRSKAIPLTLPNRFFPGGHISPVPPPLVIKEPGVEPSFGNPLCPPVQPLAIPPVPFLPVPVLLGGLGGLLG
ncbi:hypothetical protein V3C99_009385 [Haemonchus contortus]